MMAVSLSCRTWSTSQLMTASARRGTRAAPRSTLSRIHWVTAKDTKEGQGGKKAGGRVARESKAHLGSAQAAVASPRSRTADSHPGTHRA